MVPWAMIVKGIASTIGGSTGGVANSIDQKGLQSTNSEDKDGEAIGGLIGKGINKFTSNSGSSNAPITMKR